MKFNVVEVYQGRIEQIDKLIKGHVYKKHWGMVEMLRMEKKDLLQRIKEIQAREG